MEKQKIGWLINGCLAGLTIVTGIIFPNPAVIFPVTAVAALTGTIQSMFTIVETGDERKQREMRAQVKIIATNEDKNSNQEPQNIFESLHSNEKQATFKGEHKSNFQKTLDQLNAPYKKTETLAINNARRNEKPVFWDAEQGYCPKYEYENMSNKKETGIDRNEETTNEM